MLLALYYIPSFYKMSSLGLNDKNWVFHRQVRTNDQVFCIFIYFFPIWLLNLLIYYYFVFLFSCVAFQYQVVFEQTQHNIVQFSNIKQYAFDWLNQPSEPHLGFFVTM